MNQTERLPWTHKDFRYPPLPEATRTLIDERAARASFSWQRDATTIAAQSARIQALEERALTAAQYLCRLEGALLADDLDMKLNFPGELSPTNAAEALVPGFDSIEYDLARQSREGAK
jgi:hypothetical protein